MNPGAWRAALRVFEHAYGRAPEAVDEPLPFPDTPEALAALSWEQMKVLAATFTAAEPALNGTPETERPPTLRRPPRALSAGLAVRDG